MKLLRANQISSSLVEELYLDLIPGYSSIKTAGDCLFSPDSAIAALQFFESYLTHVKGELAKKPFILEPWEAAIIANMFGWKNKDGTRRYRYVFIYVPRKNGKTAIAAGIILCVMFTDGEPGAELYSAAADKDQASLVFDQARGMVLQCPELKGPAKVHVKAITLPGLHGSYKPISADAYTKHGYNTHCAVMDELHTQPDRELVEVLETSTGARRSPLIVYITTADYDRPSICNEKYEYACQVRDGLDVREFLPVIYEAKKEDDWTSEEIWKKANPNLGVSLSIDYMRSACKEAQQTPAKENTFRRLHLNQRTEQDVRWIQMQAWDGCDKTFTLEDLQDQPCWGGLDLASVSDLCAFAAYFPHLNALLMKFWCPSEAIKVRTRKKRLPYEKWVDEGFIKATTTSVSTDYDIIKQDLVEFKRDFNLRDIAIDRWNSSQLMNQLGQEGIEVVPFGQGFASMSEPSKEFERLITTKDLRHNGNPVLRWMVGNVSAELDAAGNVKPSRKVSTEKIDGVVAAVMAIGRALGNAGTGKSVYETRGLITT